jgi:hypothetical protein
MEILLCQLVNVRGVNDVRQTEKHTVKLLVPEPSHFENEIANDKVKRYKAVGVNQILAEIIQVGGKTSCSEIQKHS